MSNISSQSELTTKEIVEQAIQDYHESILPFLNGQVPVIANKFDKSNLYSTDEQIVGRWKNGKPVYQKTIELPSNIQFLYNLTWQNICDAPSVNLEEIVDCKMNVSFNQVGYDTNSVTLTSVCYDSNTHKIKAWDSASSGTNYALIKNVTVQYTKTTDEAIAIGSDTDYSLEEKIVGTWIDGKSLYQNTVSTGTAVPSSATEISRITNGQTGYDTIQYTKA